jgi:hypothetical protein
VAAVDETEQPTTGSEPSETTVAAPTEGLRAKRGSAGAGTGGMGTWLSAVPGPGGGVSAGFGRGGIDWRQLLRQRIENHWRAGWGWKGLCTWSFGLPGMEASKG